ncbi:HTH_48 domain-containing protein [Trichonephila clavipes]|nr:HTH_48 domain-containing protein [Trichonephila clavipes]
MFKVIESPAKCEIQSVIRFLTARNRSAADIHRHVTEVYGTEAMSDSKIRKRKLSSRWVPRLLTAEHEEKRFAISLDFLIRYEEERDDMLSRIVTEDETWVSISSRNQSNSLWNGDTHPLPLRSKPNKRCQNLRLWCLLRNSAEAPKSITKQTVRHAIKRFFAPPHTSRTTRELIESFGWEVLDDAPYSLDLAPSDFHLFRYLKHWSWRDAF